MMISDKAISKADETDLTDDNNPQETAGENWLLFILSIPKIGDFLSFCIAVAPFFVLMMVLTIVGDVFGVDVTADQYMEYVILAAIIPTYFWLVFLEDKANIRLCLPIPVVNIPITWVLFPVFALFALSAVGITV